jgi:hypothetical protein
LALLVVAVQAAENQIMLVRVLVTELLVKVIMAAKEQVVIMAAAVEAVERHP